MVIQFTLSHFSDTLPLLIFFRATLKIHSWSPSPLLYNNSSAIDDTQKAKSIDIEQHIHANYLVQPRYHVLAHLKQSSLSHSFFRAHLKQ